MNPGKKNPNKLMTNENKGRPSKNLGPLISEANNMTSSEAVHKRVALWAGVPPIGNQGIKNNTKRQESAPSLNGILIFVKVEIEKWVKIPRVHNTGIINQRLRSTLPLNIVEAKKGQKRRAA